MSLDPSLIDWLDGLRAQGIPLAVADPLIQGDTHDGPLIPDPEDVRSIATDHHGVLIEHRDAGATIAADHATFLVMEVLGRHVDVAGARTLDLGCGTGVITVGLARQGASDPWAADVQPEAVACARATMQASGVDATVVESDLLADLPAQTRFDLIVANLPHKPGSVDGDGLPIAQAGGGDGADLWRRAWPGIQHHLAPDGALVFFHHSLPDPWLLRTLGQRGTLTLRAWRRRVIQPGEWGAFGSILEARSAQGTSWLERDGERISFLAGVWHWCR